MKNTWRVTMKRLFRIATLVAPSWLAWYVAFSTKHPGELVVAVKYALGPLWMAVAAALVLRGTAIVFVQKKQEASLLERIDVLTGRGSALAWSSAFAIILAVKLGYASFAAVGLLGTGLFHVVVLYTFLALSGSDPIRASTITRRFTPQAVREDEELVEELSFAGTRIPIGFRLFVTGRIGPRWTTCRHVLSATESGANVVLEAEVGPALRGEHDPEPLVAWLEDTFGLTRGTRIRVPGERLIVAAKQPAVDRPIKMRDLGIGPRAPRRTFRLPTEGAFDLREYHHGDDVRRIHWVRSLAIGEIVVRLPDELPPDQPRIRLVLDTYFPEALAIECDATAEMLDALVGTWLAVARSLSESGARVTLVTTASKEHDVEVVRHVVSPRTAHDAARIAARIGWQNRVPWQEMITDEATFVVTRGLAARPSTDDRTRFIVVYPTIAEPKWPLPNVARVPYPMGSSENRWTHRQRIADERALARTDHARAMVAMRNYAAAPPAGSFVAVPSANGTIHMEVVR